MEVAEDRYMTFRFQSTKPEVDGILNKTKILYVFAVLTYRDESLPAGQYWVSEFCAARQKNA